MAACALLFGVDSMNAYQTPTANGIYYVFNTGVTSSGPGFMSRGNNYGQQAVISPFGLPVKLISTGEADTYYFQFLDNDKYLSDNGFMYTDGSTQDHKDNDNNLIESDPDRRRAIKVVLQNDGIYKLINTNNNDTEVENWYGNIVGDGEGNRRDYLWKFLSPAEYEEMVMGYTTTDNMAVASSMGWTLSEQTTVAFKEYLSANYVPVDKTSLIQHATFDTTHNTDGWTVTGSSLAWGNEGGDKITPEIYQGHSTIEQEVTVDKAGVYKVSVNSFYRCGNYETLYNNNCSGSVSYLQANNNKVRICDIYSIGISSLPGGPNAANNNFFSQGKYLNEVYVYVPEGETKTIKISLVSPGVSGGGWFVFNNFKLAYYSDEVSEEAATALLGTVPTDPMLKATKDALASAKNTFENSKTVANYNALYDAIGAANLSIVAYAPLGEKLTEAASVKTAVSSNSPSYVNTFDTNIATITINYNEGNIAEADIATQIGNVETEIRNLVKSQTVEGSDMSRAIPNAAGNAAVNNDNWKIQNALAEGENFRLDTWAGSASGMSVPMIEYWIANGNTLSGNTIYQTISGLAAGTYTVTATIAVNNESKVAPNAGSALLFANDKTKDITSGGAVTSFSGNTGTFSVSVTLSEGQDLKIGLITVEPNYNWIAFKDFKLIKGEIKPKSISLDKTSANLMAGETTTIKATVDEDASNKTVIWTSSNEKVATVANGLISAVGAGSATITAKCEANENVSTTASVSVTNAAAPKNWTVLPDGFDQGDFFIRNVGTGKFLGGANSWGTQASIIQHGIPFGLTKIAEGKYTLNSYTYNSESDHFFNGAFIDQPETNIFVTKLSNGNYALSTAEGKYVTANAGSMVVDNKAANSNASLAQWQFLSADDMLKNLKDGDTDATFFLSEANISRNLRKSNGASAWTGTKYERNGGWDNGFRYGGPDENQCGETWHAKTNSYQTVSVPNGTYTVRVQGFYRPDNSSADASYLYANVGGEDVTVALKELGTDGAANSMDEASALFSNDKYWNVLSGVTVTNNKLTVGIKTDDENNWTIWDNFELELTSGGVFNVEPAITNGDYYLANSGKYITRRGGTDGERNEGVLANEGELLAKVTTNTAGISIISFYEKGDGADGTDGSPIKERLFLSRDQVYTDGKRHVEKAHHHHFWAIEAVSGGFKLRNIEDGRYLAVKEDNTVTVAEEGTVWIFDTQSSALDLYNSALAAEGSFNPGFENGEHAPYNNVAKLSAIAHVKELGSEGQYPSLKIAPLSTAISSDWVANSGEVNAIYDGTFNNAPVNPATGGVNGWSAAEGLRQLVKSDVEGSIVSTGMYVWGKNVMTYGETTGYTLPLKANTVYKLTYDRASWEGESSTHSDVTIKDPNGNVLGTASEKGSAGYWKSTDGTLISQTVYFVTTNAGNYTLLMCPWGNTVFTNMELKKTNDVLTFADGSVPSYLPGTYPSVKIDREFSSDKWSTAVYPFAVSADKIAVLKSYDAESGKLAFESASASTPNVPFLLKNDGAITTLSNVEVSAAVAEDAYDADSIVSLKGVYAQTSVEAEEGVTNYVLSNNKIYKIGANPATVNPYHAYIQLALPMSAPEARELTFTVDGETTGISEVKARNNADGNIYNLNGQRVKNAKKGVYIMNGKTVIVK